ncbi:hypothetical protein [Vreelandella sp. TE19]
MLHNVKPLKKCLPFVMLGVAVSVPAFAQTLDPSDPDDMAEMQQQMVEIALMQPGATTTSDGATLPLYPDAEVRVHFTDPSVIPSMDGGTLGEDALPTIMMASEDSVAEVTDFYEEQLDGFTRLDYEAEGVTFGKGLPEDLSPMEFERWANLVPYHEHVSIYEQSGETIIEMAYQPE